MHASQVVSEIPLAGKSIPGDGTLATLVGAEVRLVAMAVHPVSLALMSEEAGGGRELGVLARIVLAAKRLQVRVDEFATGG